MIVAWACLIDFDDDEAGYEGRYADEVEYEMGNGASAFLRGRVRGLKDQRGLRYEE